jgi:IS30 family transposase
MSHLNISEREIIENMIKLKKAQKDMVEILCRDKGTISREISRNGGREKYSAATAHFMYSVRRKASVYHKDWNIKLFEHIKEQLKKRKSPDAIAGRLKFCKDKSIKISHQTIYNWIIKGLFGKSIVKFLLFGKNGYKKSENTLKSLKSKKRIDEMPDNYRNPNEIGHLEGDTMHGKNQSGAIATFVDKFSKYIFADKMEDKKADTFSKAMQFVFSDIENDKLKSIVEDNGSEMFNFESDEEMLNCEIYFAYPGHPWEKALVENSNRLLRRFFPKNMSFKDVTREMVLQAVEWLNHLPRKSLGYRSAYEVFHNITPVAFDI